MIRLGTTRKFRCCDRCGRKNLASTVAFQARSGKLHHYGAECARRLRGSGEMEHYRKHGTVLTPSMLRRIRKREIGAVDSTRVVLVDGEVVRDRVDIDFTTGGNPSRYRYVPNGEVWVERTTPSDLAPNIVHEIVEAKLMRKGLSYDKAHDRASRVEGGMRREIASGKLRVRDSRDAVRAANWFLNPRNRPLGKGTQP